MASFCVTGIRFSIPAEDHWLFVDNPVLELCKFCTVPASGRSYKVSGDSLELVYLGALAVRTPCKVFVCILESAVKAAVPVVVYRAVSDVVSVH